MPYDERFYELYSAYLKEPGVRAAHGWMFHVARINPAFRCVVDFGCGRHQEFLRYGLPQRYIGIDLEVEEDLESMDRLVRDNYRTMDLSKIPPGITSFVSLFSSEITSTAFNNYLFYDKVFKELPEIQVGLVAGFYYKDRLQENPVLEAGGISSYQTLETPEMVERPLYREKRIIMPVPSNMFGPYVYEVWKLFERRVA